MNPPPNDRATTGVADGGTVPLRPPGNPNDRGYVVSHGNSFFATANRWFRSLLLPETAVVIQNLRHLGREPRGSLGSHPMPVMALDGLSVARAAGRGDSGPAA